MRNAIAALCFCGTGGTRDELAPCSGEGGPPRRKSLAEPTLAVSPAALVLSSRLPAEAQERGGKESEPRSVSEPHLGVLGASAKAMALASARDKRLVSMTGTTFSRPRLALRGASTSSGAPPACLHGAWPGGARLSLEPIGASLDDG